MVSSFVKTASFGQCIVPVNCGHCGDTNTLPRSHIKQVIEYIALLFLLTNILGEAEEVLSHRFSSNAPRKSKPDGQDAVAKRSWTSTAGGFLCSPWNLTVGIVTAWKLHTDSSVWNWLDARVYGFATCALLLRWAAFVCFQARVMVVKPRLKLL